MDTNAIGKVTATENKPTSCNTVRFWVQKDQVIRTFDIVRIPHLKDSHTYAIVQDMQYITDSAGHLANYVSSDFGSLDAQPQYDRLGTTIAEAEILYNNKDIEMPVRDGAVVEWADEDGIRDALGLGAFEQPIPAGYIGMSNGTEIPIELDARYLLGPEGAHLNIAGISGLATKTSYGMFLLSSIQQVLREKVTIIVFNVKGNDLLAIDDPDPSFTEYMKAEWSKCGLEAKPFSDVTYLYPYANRPNGEFTSSHADASILKRQQEDGRAFNYFYDVETGRGRLPLLFSDIEDPNSTMDSIMHYMSDSNAESWDAYRDEITSKTFKGTNKGGDVSVMSWRRFSRLLRTRTENDLFTERSVTGTEKRRQVLVREAIKELKPGGVLVVDVEPLPDYLQCLVFGDVVQTVYGAKLGDDEEIKAADLGTVVIFADELNKYAPKTSESGRTLTRNLLEITERGRSLGVVLFGAEQFRSGVHDRVLGNCSTNVYGRTSPVEIKKCPDYQYFPEAHRSTITRLGKGNLLLQHAVFKTSLVKVRFPYPCYFQPKGR